MKSVLHFLGVFTGFFLWLALIMFGAAACQSGCTSIPTLPTSVTATTTVSTPPTTTAEGGSETAPPVECEWVPSSRTLGSDIGARGIVQTPRIVGGEPSPPRAFPWTVALETSSGWQFCAGTVIAPRWVLTAAHCRVEPGDMVHAGTDNLETPGQLIRVEEARNHPRWHSTTSGYDVAVLRIAVDASVPAIELANETPASGTMTAIGWGALCEGCAGTPVQQFAEVPLLNRDVCRRAYGLVIDETMFCAGDLEDGGTDSCQGDSGGPSVIRAGDSHKQIGIVSWGEGCARPDTPGVYTRVSAVREWIEACAR